MIFIFIFKEQKKGQYDDHDDRENINDKERILSKT